MSRRATAAAAAALATAVLVGCATTVDREIAGDTTTARDGRSTTTTTVFVATGTTEELLDRLLDESRSLSEAIVENQGQHDVVARIDSIWDAVRPAVENAHPQLMLEFERAIVMLHTAVDRRRPADADKAYTNLLNLVAATR